MMEGDKGLGNPVHVHILETRALCMCLDSPLRNAEDHGKKVGSIGHNNY